MCHEKLYLYDNCLLFNCFISGSLIYESAATQVLSFSLKNNSVSDKYNAAAFSNMMFRAVLFHYL